MAVRRRARGILVGALIVFTACGDDSNGGATATPAESTSGGSEPSSESGDSAETWPPFDDRAEMRPERMTAEPAEVTPGSHVELRFPEETQRGVAFSLEQGVDEGWSQTHMLFSDVLGDPASTPVSGQMDVPDRAVWGPGPDVVVVPSDANPGNYRVCTVNLSGNFCTTLEIVASS